MRLVSIVALVFGRDFVRKKVWVEEVWFLLGVLAKSGCKTWFLMVNVWWFVWWMWCFRWWFFGAEKCDRFLDLFSGNALKVGALEGDRILEAVAEEAVEGDVGYPDEGEGCYLMPLLDVTG